jgi:ectoine hydroxylase-related dioxygenase (phytanoyl-CoA dioxygenase family)
MYETQSTSKSTVAVDMPGSATRVRKFLPKDADKAMEQLARRVTAAWSNAARPAWKILIDLWDDRPILVDCKAGSVIRIADSDSASVDSKLSLSPLDMLQIMEGMDARFALLFLRMTVSGSIEIATKFCDEVAGRKITSKSNGGGKPLPKPTSDHELGKSQIEEFGYCIIKDVLSTEQISALRLRVDAQAAGERLIGRAVLDGAVGSAVPPNQRVRNIVNKGKVFLDLLDHPIFDEFASEFLGEYYQVSSFFINIAGPGGIPQYLHTDQIGLQPPISGRIGLNLLLFLDDVMESNGGTRLMPASHRGNVAPDNILSTDGTIAAEGPAGSALIFDSRVWHGTGANTSQGKRRVVVSFFVRHWMRTTVNHALSVHPTVFAKMSERAKIMHGFRCTGSLGGFETPIEGAMTKWDPDRLVLAIDADGSPSKTAD